MTFFSCHWLLIETLNIESWKFAGLSFSLIPEAAAYSSAPLRQLSQLPALNWIWHFTSILSGKSISPATQFNLWHLMHVCINGEGKRKKEVLIWGLVTTSSSGCLKHHCVLHKHRANEMIIIAFQYPDIIHIRLTLCTEGLSTSLRAHMPPVK